MTNKILIDGRTELYRNGKRNSSIATSGVEYFGVDETDLQSRQKHGSFNRLVIVSQATTPISIALDGLTEKTWILPSTGSFEIKATEGLFFDFVVITNSGASTIDADKISVTWAKAVEVI